MHAKQSFRKVVRLFVSFLFLLFLSSNMVADVVDAKPTKAKSQGKKKKSKMGKQYKALVADFKNHPSCEGLLTEDLSYSCITF